MPTIDNGYYIDSWRYQATIHADNTWDVTETLTVTYNEPRHGIYHYLNRFYTDQHPWHDNPSATYSYYLNVDDVNVKDVEFKLVDEDDDYESLNIVIGSAEQTITGQHTYEISYKLTYHDDRCEEYDQLFHSVMAGNVTTEVGRFDFYLNFEKELPSRLHEPGQLSVFSAPYGVAKNTLDVHCKVSDHSIAGTIEHIPAGNAITLYSRLPEGYYESPDAESGVCFYGFFGLTIALLTYLVVDLLFLRRRPKATPVVCNHPPKGLTPAEVGTIIDDSADTSDLLSLLPWLAQQGYIRITEIPADEDKKAEPADLKLELLRPLEEDQPKYLRLFMESLFGKKLKNQEVLVSELDEHCAARLEKSKDALKKSFSGERTLCRMSGRVWLLILAYVLGFATVVFSSRVDTFRLKEFVFGLIFFGISALTWCVIGIDEHSRHLHSFKRNLVRSLIVVAVFAVLSVVGYALWQGPDSFFTPDLMLMLMCFSLVVTLFSGRYVVDTDYRLKVMGELIGLRQFIVEAEQSRLKVLVKEESTYFYQILPYAMAFGISDKWVKLFDDIEMPKPDWYLPLYLSAWSPMFFYQSFTHSVNTISEQISAQSAANASSATSGGGFAGGGGGAGGTGSW